MLFTFNWVNRFDMLPILTDHKPPVDATLSIEERHGELYGKLNTNRARPTLYYYDSIEDADSGRWLVRKCIGRLSQIGLSKAVHRGKEKISVSEQQDDSLFFL